MIGATTSLPAIGNRLFSAPKRLSSADAIPPSLLFREDRRSREFLAGCANHPRGSAGAEPTDRRAGGLTWHRASAKERARDQTDRCRATLLRTGFLDPAPIRKSAAAGSLQHRRCRRRGQRRNVGLAVHDSSWAVY